jgi:hypothetical protein
VCVISIGNRGVLLIIVCVCEEEGKNIIFQAGLTGKFEPIYE